MISDHTGNIGIDNFQFRSWSNFILRHFSDLSVMWLQKWPVKYQIGLGSSCRIGISERNLHGGYVLSGYCLLDANGFRCTLAAISISGACLLWCFVKLRPNRREWPLTHSSRHATDHINTNETPDDCDNYFSLFHA